jgi:NADPH2:quinone reductase
MLKRKGTLVSVGNASGAVPPMAPLKLSAKNLKLCRPTCVVRAALRPTPAADDIRRMGNYIVEPEEAGPYYAELFGMVADGALKLEIHGEYAFDAAGCIQAQKDLTGGKTIGKLLLKV